MNPTKILSIRKASLGMLLAGSSALAASLPAAASDALSAAPAGFVWTGGYIGLQTGHAWGDSRYVIEGLDGTFIDYDPKGLIGGAFAGYNHQIGNLVLGGEADLNFSGVGRERAAEHYTGGGEYSDHYGTADMKWNAAIRGRLGYSMNRLLPYVAAGVAFTNYNVKLWHVGDDEPHFTKDASLTGWTIGAGVEYAATDNLIVRADYRYTDYGSVKWDDPSWGNDLNVDLKTHDLRLGVAYKF